MKVLEERLNEAESTVEALKNEVATARQQMEEAKNYIGENLPIAQSSINDIRAHRASSVTAANEIQSLSSQSKETLEELKEATNEMLAEGGLQDQAKVSIQTINEQKDKQQQDFEELMTKINTLLPGAASVGLAHAYKTQKDSYKGGGILWPTVFIIAVGAIVAVGVVSFSDITTAPTLEEAVVKLIARLPYYLAAVWLAAFASRRQSQNKRLQQEYAHKETLALSLQGYKREIEELGNPTLMTKLMDSVVEMVGFNPSTTLDGKHGDDGSPLHSFFGLGKKPKEKKSEEEE